ncbi:hypothetical protein ACFQDG_18080 [Natronoarchaeum mannanilyticum]|uniref:PGF-CTERM sorting domain-containing protein n=1 Tax=Natronoarchaeum mannanilyticum TaxID=926360 RepID=A0AAV3TG80_9EURY
MTGSDADPVADTGSETDANSDAASTPPWGVLGAGGAVSLCCLFAAPAANGVAGGAAVGGATAAAGGSLTLIVVTALTVGLLGAAFRLRSSGRSCNS